MAGYLILGMHRSGTSCFAGCLEAGGLSLGAVNVHAPFNQKGNREHEPIRGVHDEMLADNEASWDRPPNGQIEIKPEHLEKLKFYVEQFDTDQDWGVKDPRSIFFAKSWQRHFGCEFLGTCRHPIEVAESLESRAARTNKQMSRDSSLAIWRSYNAQLLDLYRAKPFPLIRYGIEPKLYLEQIGLIARQLNLNPDGASTFFTKTLTHQASAGAAVPECCKNIWDELLCAWDVCFKKDT